MPTSPARIVAEFLQAFMSGEVDKASRMVREDFSFQAPMQEGHAGKAAYFAGAKEKAKFIKAFRILRQWADGDEVSTFYELDIETSAGAATMPMSEWHTLKDGKLASTFMVFNGSANAVQLLRNALSGHH